MADTIETKARPALSGWPMIIGWIAMLIFAGHASTHMVAAGDTWVALACGRHFCNHGVNTVEPFSANSHKAGPTAEEVKTWPQWAQWITDKVGLETVKYWHPTGWVNQNWLTHVIFYWLAYKSPFADAHTLSFNTLVYWKLAIYILAVACVYYIGRVLGVNPALSAVFACFAMFVGRSFLDVRPAGFSNLLVPVFILILVLTTYRNVLYIWLLVPVMVFWCNVHGGYIYAFIMLGPFVALNFLTSFSKKRFVSIGRKGVYHTIAAGVVSFIAAVVFNPFHLTNLTHTFVISVSKHAEMWRTVNEWHPAFEWNNPVGDEIPFLIMYIIAWAAFAAWAVILILAPRSVNRFAKRKPKVTDEYQWPKIDLALIVIAALTVYMAIRSRRFIPIAASVACPLLAMLIDQAVRAISAAYNFRRQNRLCVSPMPRNVRLFFILAGVAAVLVFGVWWGLKFKRVYLDPWPSDTRFTSVFMRLTASDAKPFYACQFIKGNKLEGKMYNYWTEGGFIAWGQEPDPNTGRTSLQLFVDGRAQAAYEPRVYLIWSEIMFVNQLVQSARVRNQPPDYVQLGRWIDQQMRKYDVWVVLMPVSEFGGHFLKGLETNPDWHPVYFDDKQRLFIDMKSPRGKNLFEGVFTGQTFYPDECSKNLAIAHILLGREESAAEGLDFAVKSLELNPSLAAMMEVVSATRFAQLRPRVNDFCKNYFDDFVKNKNLYAKKDGYHLRGVAALYAAGYLQNTAEVEKNTGLVEFYRDRRNEYTNELRQLGEEKRW